MSEAGTISGACLLFETRKGWIMSLSKQAEFGDKSDFGRNFRSLSLKCLLTRKVRKVDLDGT
jgi:hypothetical protein